MKNHDETKRYNAVDAKGNHVRVSVPEDMTATEELMEAVRNCLSPHAVAAMAACLQTARTDDEGVNCQLAWFRKELVMALGGPDRQNELAEELGM